MTIYFIIILTFILNGIVSILIDNKNYRDVIKQRQFTPSVKRGNQKHRGNYMKETTENIISVTKKWLKKDKSLSTKEVNRAIRVLEAGRNNIESVIFTKDIMPHSVEYFILYEAMMMLIQSRIVCKNETINEDITRAFALMSTYITAMVKKIITDDKKEAEKQAKKDAKKLIKKEIKPTKKIKKIKKIKE